MPVVIQELDVTPAAEPPAGAPVTVSEPAGAQAGDAHVLDRELRERAARAARLHAD